MMIKLNNTKKKNCSGSSVQEMLHVRSYPYFTGRKLMHTKIRLTTDAKSGITEKCWR